MAYFNPSVFSVNKPNQKTQRKPSWTKIGLLVVTFKKVKLGLSSSYNNCTWLKFRLSHFVFLLFAGLPVGVEVAAKRFPALVVALVKPLTCLETPLGHCHTEG